MKCFMVVVPSDSKVSPEDIAEAFPDHCYEVEGGTVWVVAAVDATAVDISERLKLEPRAEGDRSGVVVQMDHYYGLYDVSLWEKLFAWKKAA